MQSCFSAVLASAESSILLMPIGVMDEQLLGILGVKLLPALGTLEAAIHLDANVGY